MKNYLVGWTSFLFLLLATFSCKKEDLKNNTDLAESAQGEYEVYYIKEGGQTYNLPQGGVSATVYLNKSEKDRVDVRFVIRDGNTGETQEAEFGEAELRSESSAVTMYINSEKLGTINDDQLELKGGDGQGGDFIIRARK